MYFRFFKKIIHTFPSHFYIRSLLCIFLLFGISCVKDKPIVQNNENPSSVYTGETGRIFVLNEGNFGSGNGSVSLYEPYSGSVTEDYFFKQNNTQAGDVVQSMFKHNGSYFLVVNNSGKIYKLNAGFKITGTLSGLTSPRYLIPLQYNRLMVTDLYSNTLTIFDPDNMQVVQTIAFPGWGERMEKYLNKIFITNMKKNFLYVFDIYSSQITDSIPVAKGSHSLQWDKNGKLWVLCNGDIMQSVPGALYRINPVTHQVEWSASFASGNPHSLCINPTRDTLYYILNGIYRISINATQLPSSVFIPQGNKNFYALGVHPSSGNLYVSDAKDYLQKSDIYVYRSNGTLLGSFKAGIISGNFFFD